MIRLRFSLIIAVFLGFCFCLPATAVIAAEKHLISVVLPNNLQRYQQIQAAFLPALQTVCAADCRVYTQTPNADAMSLRNSVRKAVALGSRMIITYGANATAAAKLENPDIPVLFVDVVEPHTLGFVASNKMAIAGVRGDAPLPSLLRYFVESTDAKVLAVLYQQKSPDSICQRDTLRLAAARMNVRIVELGIDNDDDASATLRSMTEAADGLFLAHGELLAAQLGDIMEEARSRRLPVISQVTGMAELGAFMTLETDPDEQGEQLAVLAGQVLAGQENLSPSIVNPRKVTFVVNLKTANTLNLKVPLQNLAAATRIIR